jgi:hypothetical protein
MCREVEDLGPGASWLPQRQRAQADEYLPDECPDSLVYVPGVARSTSTDTLGVERNGLEAT